MCTGQRSLPSGGVVPSARGCPCCRAGISPARTSDDLPLPEAPTTASRLLWRRKSTNSAVSASRPKKLAGVGQVEVLQTLVRRWAGGRGAFVDAGDSEQPAVRHAHE